MHHADDWPHRHAPESTLNLLRKLPLLAEAQNWRCAYCHVDLVTDALDDRHATIDEVVARGSGGTRRWSNQVAACWLCNNGRGSVDAFGYALMVQKLGRDRAAGRPGKRRAPRPPRYPPRREPAKPPKIKAPQFGLR